MLIYLIQPFDNTQVAHRTIAEHLQSVLVGGAVMRRDCLLDDVVGTYTSTLDPPFRFDVGGSFAYWLGLRLASTASSR